MTSDNTYYWWWEWWDIWLWDDWTPNTVSFGPCFYHSTIGGYMFFCYMPACVWSVPDMSGDRDGIFGLDHEVVKQAAYQASTIDWTWTTAPLHYQVSGTMKFPG
jgi:hypothetical protein